MFAYSLNNPVSMADDSGDIPMLSTGVSAIASANPIVLLVVVVLAALTLPTLVSNGSLPSISFSKEIQSNSKEDEESKVGVVPRNYDTPVVFPENPHEFMPAGLIKITRNGTKNGALISWMNPLTNTEVFRWDENINFANGPHYHINGTGHYSPGEPVPEPYASFYFPFR